MVFDPLFLTRGYAELASFVVSQSPGVQRPTTAPPYKSSEACAIPSHEADELFLRRDALTQARLPLGSQGRCASPTTPFVPPDSTSEPMEEPSLISNIGNPAHTVESTRSTPISVLGNDLYAESASTAPMQILGQGDDVVLATGGQAVSTRTLHPARSEDHVVEVEMHRRGAARAVLQPEGFSSPTGLLEGDSTRISSCDSSVLLTPGTSAALDGAQARHAMYASSAEDLIRAGEDIAETATEAWPEELQVTTILAGCSPVNLPPELARDVGISNTAYMWPRERASVAASGVTIADTSRVSDRDHQAWGAI